MATEFTKKELVLWGLGECGGVRGFVDTETIGVFLFELHPGAFGLKKFPKYPDIDVVRIQLADAKRDKGAEDPCRVTQDTDERKRRARESGEMRRVLSRTPMWKLNEVGVRWYESHRQEIADQIASARALGERRAPGGSAVRAKQISAAVLERIRKRPSFARFAANPAGSWGETDLGILDFFTVFNLDAHTPERLCLEATTRVLAAVEANSAEEKYAKRLSDLYGIRYRHYYDELLARGDA